MVRPKYLESSLNGTSDAFSSVISAMKWFGTTSAVRWRNLSLGAVAVHVGRRA